MPVYEYSCPQCGIFPEFRPMDARNRPARCPQCSTAAARIVSAPNLAVMNPLHREAHSRNERSQHEPRVSGSHSCSSRCGCGKPAASASTSASAKSALVAERPMRRRKTPARPWMLGH